MNWNPPCNQSHRIWNPRQRRKTKRKRPTREWPSVWPAVISTTQSLPVCRPGLPPRHPIGDPPARRTALKLKIHQDRVPPSSAYIPRPPSTKIGVQHLNWFLKSTRSSQNYTELGFPRNYPTCKENTRFFIGTHLAPTLKPWTFSEYPNQRLEDQWCGEWIILLTAQCGILLKHLILFGNIQSHVRIIRDLNFLLRAFLYHKDYG